MESALCSIWQVDIRSSVRNDLFICREYHIGLDYIEKLPYYKYEWLLHDINEQQKKEAEHQKQQEQNSSYKMPKTPALPKVSLPKF